MEYLGHVVSGRGVQPDPSKVQAILDWPIPLNLKDLRAFLGLTEFYYKFVKGYTAIAAPLTALLYKDDFHWTSTSQMAFEQLKLTMMAAPVLALLDFSMPFTLETDASGITMGVVLMQ